jgi:hypothetical protein
VKFESGSKLVRIGVKAFSRCLSLHAICIPASVEILCECCFAGCGGLVTLTFESGSKLARIEPRAFSNCFRLNSIAIPKSIQKLSKEWAMGSALRRVIFESASSLRKMIERGDAALCTTFEIRIAPVDCKLDSADILPRCNPSLPLARLIIPRHE